MRDANALITFLDNKTLSSRKTFVISHSSKNSVNTVLI